MTNTFEEETAANKEMNVVADDNKLLSDQKVSPLNQSSCNDATLDKAVRFWTHPSLANVSADQKIQYLKSRGMSKDDIHQAWERMTTTESKDAAVVGRDGGGAFPVPPPLHPTVMEPMRQPTPLLYPPQPPPPPPTLPIHSSSEEDGAYVPALLTVGGMLGLGAAAAVRWLNGGDFSLFPPPTRQGAILLAHQQQQQEETPRDDEFQQQQQQQDDEIIQEENHLDSEDLPVPSKDDQMDVLIGILQNHCGQQDRILQQLSNFSTKQVTDSSMNLLRKTKEEDDKAYPWMIWAQLVEVKAALFSLKEGVHATNHRLNGGASQWEGRLNDTLQKLEACIDNLKPREGVATKETAQRQLLDVESPMHGSAAQFQSIPAQPQFGGDTDEEESSLRDAIKMLALENEQSVLRAGAQLLYLYVINLSSHPHIPRYRKIFTTNESFQKVEELMGGKELLFALGFVEKENCLEWQCPETITDDDVRMTRLKQAAAALSILKSPQQPSDSQSLERAIASVVSIQRPKTPPQPPPSILHEIPLLQTPKPDIFIMSPPTTKKQSFGEFPQSPDILMPNVNEATFHVKIEANHDNEIPRMDADEASLAISTIKSNDELGGW